MAAGLPNGAVQFRLSPNSRACSLIFHIASMANMSSIPRSNSRSSTFRKDSGNRTYIITTRRITSGDELKYRNGLPGFAIDFRLMRARISYARALPRWSENAITIVEKLAKPLEVTASDLLE